MSVPAKNVVTFKPGKEMEELVRQMNSENLPKEDDPDADVSGNGPTEANSGTLRVHRPAATEASD